MKLAILSSTLLLSAVLAAPVPAAPDATHLAAPAASPGGTDPLGIDQTLSNLGLLPPTPPLPPSPPSPPSPRAVSSASAPSASSALSLEQTLDSLIGVANGEQTGNSKLGGIKKRTSDLSSPAPSSLDLNSLVGELTGSQKGDTNDLSGIVPTMKRTPQGSSGITVDGVPVPVGALTGVLGALGKVR